MENGKWKKVNGRSQLATCIFLLTFSIFHFPFSIANCRAESLWTLTSDDFQSQSVRLLALDEKGLRCAPAAGGDELFIPIERFLQITRSLPAPPPDAKAAFILELSGGDRLTGLPVEISAENILWDHPILGRMNVSLRQAKALYRPDAAPLAQEPSVEDVVLLSNGDRVAGVISEIGSEQLSIRAAGAADSAAVAIQSIVSITFASVPTSDQSPGPPARGFRLLLDDTTRISVSSLTLDSQWTMGNGQWATAIPHSAFRVPHSSVAGVEQINGPVIWLSSLTPSESERTSFLNNDWPARMDASVTGGPVRLGRRIFSRGIGVHAKSRLTFDLTPLAGRFGAFRTQYAIDGDGPLADVTVRIKIADRVAHEQAGVRAGKLWPIVTIDLPADAKKLTLEVDFGQSYDVQDRFLWIEPALLRDDSND